MVDCVTSVCLYGYGAHRELHVLTHSFPTRRSSDRLVGGFPRELGFGTAEMAIGRRLGINGPQQVEHVDDALGAQVEVLAHQLGDLFVGDDAGAFGVRSEEHTYELQSLMRISYAVFCLKKKKKLHIKNNLSLR